MPGQDIAAILEGLPFCSLCFKDITQILHPYLSRCKHLHCSSCINATAKDGFYVCPLDYIKTPLKRMQVPEALESYSWEFVDCLEQYYTRENKEQLAGMLQALAVRMNDEVSLELLPCKNCKKERLHCPCASLAAIQDTTSPMDKLEEEAVKSPETSHQLYPEFPDFEVLSENDSSEYEVLYETGEETGGNYLELSCQAADIS